jgi:peptide/nickel transport system substrate-binding protein
MTYGNRTSSRSVVAKTVAALLAVTLLAAACGGKKLQSNKNPGKASAAITSNGESGLATAGKPVRGGKLIYGLEAETGGGYCLAEGQLAISGILVAKAFYDTLTVPNDISPSR